MAKAAKEDIHAVDADMDLDSLLERVREADVSQAEAQLQIAILLAAIKSAQIYKPTYDSFKMMVQCELDFAVSAADRYVSLYNSYVKLGYGREAFLKLMRQLGWRKVQYCLSREKRRMTYKEMKEFLEDNYYAQDRQFNFNMRSDSTATKLEKALKPFGLTIDELTGRRHHLTESLEAMLDDYTTLKRKARSAARTSKAKAKTAEAA